MSDLLEEIMLPRGGRLGLRRGDITEEAVDAIVNAANEFLQHGGGVAGAISRKGGSSIQTESSAIGYTATGTAAITTAGALPAQFVIHAVGPVWSQYRPAEAECLLASAVESALEIAAARSLESVAFPAISSGIYGFPKDRCAAVMLHSLRVWLAENADTTVKNVSMVLFDDPTVEAFRAAWREEFLAEYN